MSDGLWPTLMDGHRVCTYCDMLERPPWPHPYPPEPWLCYCCRGRCLVDATFARRVADQLRYSASELPVTADEQLADLALQHYVAVWRMTAAGRDAQMELEADDRPF